MDRFYITIYDVLNANNIKQMYILSMFFKAYMNLKPHLCSSIA